MARRIDHFLNVWTVVSDKTNYPDFKNGRSKVKTLRFSNQQMVGLLCFGPLYVK